MADEKQDDVANFLASFEVHTPGLWRLIANAKLLAAAPQLLELAKQQRNFLQICELVEGQLKKQIAELEATVTQLRAELAELEPLNAYNTHTSIPMTPEQIEHRKKMTRKSIEIYHQRDNDDD